MLLRRMGRPGLLGLAARTAVVAGTASAVTGAMNRRRQTDLETEQAAEAYESEQRLEQQRNLVAQAAPASSAPDDVVSQLERLAALQQQGVLTAGEFADQKAKILAGG